MQGVIEWKMGAGGVQGDRDPQVAWGEGQPQVGGDR